MQALKNNIFEQPHDFKHKTTFSELNRYIFIIKLGVA